MRSRSLITIALHAEEPVPLAASLGRHTVIGTVAVDQLLLGQETLAANAIQPLVLGEVDVAACPHSLQRLDDDLLMPRVGGAHEDVK